MIKKALDQFAAASNKSWLLERSATVGASSVGQCARKVWFEKNADDPESPQPDPEYVDRWGAKERGTFYETHFWNPAMKMAFGDDALFCGDDQRTLVLDLLSATSDLLLINRERDCLKHLGVEDIESDCIVSDCKTKDSRINLDSLPKSENVFQIHTQIGLIRALTPYKPVYGILSYTDASWWDEVHEFPVRFDPQVFEQAKLRARDIMLAQSAQALKPEGFIAGGKDCDYCAFTRACGSARASFVPREEKPIDPATTDKIANQAKLVSALEESAENYAKEAREAKAILRDMLSEAGTRRVEGEGVKVRWTQTKGRKSVDNKALREAAEAAGIDVSAFNKIGAEGDQLVISVGGSDAAA
jgi:hypothetical protein